MFADEEEEEFGWGDDDFGCGVQRGGVEVFDDGCYGGDGAVPIRKGVFWSDVGGFLSLRAENRGKGKVHLEVAANEEFARHGCGGRW